MNEVVSHGRTRSGGASKAALSCSEVVTQPPLQQSVALTAWLVGCDM